MTAMTLNNIDLDKKESTFKISFNLQWNQTPDQKMLGA